MKISTLCLLLSTVISESASKLLAKHHSLNAEVHYDQPVVHETLADYEKELVDRLMTLEATDGTVIALAITTLIFIIVQVVIVTNFLNR